MKSIFAKPQSAFVGAFLGCFLMGASESVAQSLTINNVGTPTQVGSGAGKRAIWTNAGTVGGTTVDLVGEMTTATLNHNFTTTSSRPSITSVGQDNVFIDWTLYEAGTHDINTNSGGVPVSADIHVQVNDVDGPNNERVFVPVCSGEVDWIRIDQNATTGRDFGTVAGQAETFSLIGDANYNSQPESGLEIRYSNRSTFTIGRTANTNFLIRLDNPTYSAFDTFDYQCADFTTPVAVDDTLAGVSLGNSAVLSILNNDSAATANDNAPNNNSLLPSEFGLQSVSLVAPTGATSVTTDGAGDVISFAVTGEGSWSIDDTTGDLTFTPEAGFLADPTPITYTFRNDLGQISNAATVTVTYNIQPPVAADDSTVNATIEPVTVSPLGNDSDPDGTLDASTVVLTGTGAPSGSTLAPDGKTLTVPNEGTWTVAANGDITFSPVAGFTGDPTAAAYTVNDNDGLTSNEATVSVDYGDRPVASDDAEVSAVIEAVTISPLGNDSDADGTLVASTVVLTGTGAPSGSTLAPDGKTLTVPNEGTWSVAANGDITFTPVAGFAGDPTPAPYTVSDDDGNASNAATLSIDYGDRPVATNDAAVSAVIEAVTVSPLGNDSDADGTLVASSVVLTGTGAPSGSTLAADGKTLTVPGEGEWTVAANGDIVFTPEATFSGDPTEAAYTVDDNDGNTSNEATVSVDYGDRPLAGNDTAANPNPGTATTISPLSNDSDADGSLVPASVVLTGTGAPSGSTLAPDGKTLTVPGEGEWTVAANGDIVFTPEAGFVGDPTSVSYTVEDNDGNTSNEATIALTYGDLPIAGDDSVVSAGIEAVTVSPLANDSDADGTLVPGSVVLTGAGAPTGSTLAPDGKTLTVPNEGEWTVAANGDITFTPLATFSGDPTPAAYTVEDNDGNTSNAATVSIDFGERPTATNDMVESNTVEPITVSPLDNDTDPDGTIDPASVVLTGTGAPSGSTLAPDGKTLTVPGEGEWTVTANGDITFTPEAGYAGPTTTVAYAVDDNDGNTTNEATITINFGEPPVATNDAVTPTAPGPVSIDPLANDAADDPLDPTSVVLTGTNAPAGSVLASDGKTLTVPGEGEWTVNPTTGLVTFTPAAGFSGAPTPASYTVADLMGRTSNEAALSVMVLPALEIIATNDGPLALDGSNGGTTTVSVLNNDTLDGTPITDPSLVTLTAVTLPTLASGSIALNPDGTITVAPGSTPGTYTVVYEICETANPTNCATAQVEVVVVDAGTGLINEIEDDLKTILEEDLANTLLQQSNQISGYSGDALDRLRGRSQDQCVAAANIESGGILFDVDRAVIRPESAPALDEIAAILIDCLGTAFEIAGHTDSDASDAYNIDLSQRRVEAVRQALTDRGVDTTGYVARGYGESQPIASNATAEGKAQNRRVEFRALDVTHGDADPCEDHFNLLRSVNASADQNGVSADGAFVSDQHDCVTDRREVYEGALSYLDTDTGQTQSAINLSYRREQYRGADSVFGYFVGLYGTRSDVTRLADGDLSGTGLNAGIYGANRLQTELFVDYYLGAAIGRHSFDLAFDRTIGIIDATGDYQYFAGFAGAALSGQVELGETTLAPRVGFDYVYTPGADVDVVAELSGLSEVGGLDLDAISGGRIFAEIRSDYAIQDGQANVWINPRAACYQSLGELDGACGFGGSIGIETVDGDGDFTYALELDGEWGDGYAQGSLSFGASRNIGLGTLKGDAGVTRDGNATFAGEYKLEF